MTPRLLCLLAAVSLAMAQGPVLKVDTPMSPPAWALMERALLKANSNAARAFYQRLFGWTTDISDATPRGPHMILHHGNINAALYALASYLLLLTPLPLYRAGRRRFRVSRGLCPACAYDLKGAPNGPCPECGTHKMGQTPC